MISRIAPVSMDGLGEWSDEELFAPDNQKNIEGSWRSRMSKALRHYFEERGVPFPKGSRIEYNRGQEQLEVKNTLENLRRLNSLLRFCDHEQPQVMVKTTMVSIKDDDLIQLVGENAANSLLLKPSQIEKIIQSDKGILLFSQEVISRSGEEATARSVAEEYFPESWTETCVGSLLGHLEPDIAYPEYGEATDLGERFIVTPTVSPNNHTVTLQLNPQYLELFGVRKYKAGYAINGIPVTDTISMPIISRKDVTTNFRIYDGQTLCIGRTRYRELPDLKGKSFPSTTSWTELLEFSKTEGKELKNVFFFVTARLVNPDGKFLRRKVK